MKVSQSLLNERAHRLTDDTLDFTTPQPSGSTGKTKKIGSVSLYLYTHTIDKIVKNVQAFHCLLSTFIYPTTTNTKKSHELPPPLSIQLFQAMKEIIQSHPCNYFVVERTNAVPQLIEGMEKYDVEIQKGIMELLVFIMVDLNFVPLKELAVLSLHLQSKCMIPKYTVLFIKTFYF